MYDTNFTSQENTNLIWDLLNEHTTDRFSYNLKSNNNKLINKFFIDTINEIQKHQKEYTNIMEMNKTTLLKCINFIDKNIQYIKEPNKKDVFEIRMKKQKNQFDSLMNKKVPQKIDFSDKLDNNPVDKFAVDKTLAERERELQQITQHYVNTDAESWIKNGIKKDDDDKIKIIEEPVKNINPILMDKSSMLEKERTNKRVSFEIKEQKTDVKQSSNFLNKLKKKDATEELNKEIDKIKNDINEIHKSIKTMEDNQNKILSLVENVIKTAKQNII
tara:strand:- start:22324 stop:23145 length:822 start_codon:yes stop_codon:yes gene_type:complete